MSELPAFQTEWLDDLKFRVGYGVSGRHNFSPYQSLETYAGAGKVMVDGKWVPTRMEMCWNDDGSHDWYLVGTPYFVDLEYVRARV